MLYYSTNQKCSKVGFKEALLRSEAADGGLYMPERLPIIPNAFINNIPWMSLKEIAYVINSSFFGDDIPLPVLKAIGDQAASYPMPLYQIEPGIYVLELFHGPTKTIKDFGAQIMTRLMRHKVQDSNCTINVLVPTTGHTGNAIAQGLRDIDGINVFVLHPRNKARVNEELYSVTGDNIHVIEVNGNIDDCLELTMKAFNDPELNESMVFTSANSMNIGSLLPSTIPFFHAYAQLMKKDDKAKHLHLAVPSGNCGNLLAGYMAKLMGLPIERLIAACNINAGFHRYLQEGINDRSHRSTNTYAYGMDMRFSNNVPRFEMLCSHDRSRLQADIASEVCTDSDIADAINSVYESTGYLLDPHTATAYIALKRQLPQNASGIILATAHPSISVDVLEKLNRGKIKLPFRIKNKNICLRPEVRIQAAYGALRKILKFYSDSNISEPKFA